MFPNLFEVTEDPHSTYMRNFKKLKVLFIQNLCCTNISVEWMNEKFIILSRKMLLWMITVMDYVGKSAHKIENFPCRDLNSGLSTQNEKGLIL